MSKYLSNERSFHENGSLETASAALFLFAGIGLIAIAFLGPWFRGSELDLTGLAALPLSLGVGFLIFAFAVKKNCTTSGLWFLLALTGQAVALQLIDAGPDLRYQHYVSAVRLVSGYHLFLTAFLAIQAIIVIAGLAKRRRSIKTGLSSFRTWQLLLVSVVFFLPTAVVSHDKFFYFYEWFFAGVLQTVQLGNLYLFGSSISKDTLARIQSVVEKFSDRSAIRAHSKRLVLGAAITVVLISAFLNQVSYENHPHVPDEVAYLIHARIFAGGSLSVPAAPVPEAFEAYLLTVKDGIMYPSPPPGWPLILAIGAIFGIAWLVNPVLAGVNILIANRVLSELYPPKTAFIATLLLCVSPWYLFLGMSFMTHQAALTCALAAVLGVAYARRSGRASWAWLAGFALGFLSLIRPLEAIGMASVMGLWSIGLWGKRLSAFSTAGLVIGAVIIGSLGVVYNKTLTGDPLEFPIMEYTEKEFGPNANAYGFGPDRGMGWEIDPNPGHSPVDALINSNLNATQINTELFGWSIGSLFLVAVFFAFRRFEKSDYVMIAVIAIIYFLHFFYYFSGGPDFGARYWFLMILPLVALSARGAVLAGETLEKASEGNGLRIVACVVALSLMAIINFIPWRAIDKYHNFRGMEPYAREFMSSNEFSNGLVLVKGNIHPEYDSAMIYNDPELSGSGPIFAWDRDEETRLRLLREYPDRTVWVITCPSVSGSGYELSGGNRLARQILEQAGE